MRHPVIPALLIALFGWQAAAWYLRLPRAAAPANGMETADLRPLQGLTLQAADGSRHAWPAITNGLVGLLFPSPDPAANRRALPRVQDAWAQLERAGRPLRVVLCDIAPTAAEQDAFLQDFKPPWPAVPAGEERLRRAGLAPPAAERPQLILFDARGRLVTRRGVDDILRMGADAWEAWKP